MDNTLSLDIAMAQVQALTGQHMTQQPTMGVAGDSCMFEHMPAHDYHADRDALSCSLLKPLLISPAHFQAGLAVCETSSEARDFGSLVHLLLLQPEAVSQELAVFPGIPDRPQTLRKFAALHPGKLVVDEPMFATARRIAQKVADTPYKGRALGRFIEEAISEATIYFTEPTTGLRMRVRMDSYHPDISFDLKTSRFASTRAFARDAEERGYDLQAFMYSLARCLYEGTTAPKPFVFIVAGNTAPHSVSTLVAGETFLGNGALKFQACAAAFKACTASGYWPDLSSDGTLEIEPWQQYSAKQGWQAALATRAAPALGAPI